MLNENEAPIAALFIDVLVLFFISLHIQAFLGSRIIQNAADCLAEHSDCLSFYRRMFGWCFLISHSPFLFDLSQTTMPHYVTHSMEQSPS